MTYLIPTFWQAFGLLVYMELQIHIPISNLLISNILISVSKIWVKKEHLLEFIFLLDTCRTFKYNSNKILLAFPIIFVVSFHNPMYFVYHPWLRHPFIFDYSLNGLLFVSLFLFIWHWFQLIWLFIRSVMGSDVSDIAVGLFPWLCLNWELSQFIC